jgi:hypothetical protein
MNSTAEKRGFAAARWSSGAGAQVASHPRDTVSSNIESY